MLELMVAIAIIVALVSLVVLGARAAQNFSRKSNAQQQLKLLQNAIDQYAGFWQPWRVGSVVVAEKGWPDFIPGRLFSSPPYNPALDNANFNTGPTSLRYDVDDGITYSANDEMTFGEGAAEFGIECLFFALTSSSGKGPYIKDEMKGDLQSTHNDEFYPTLAAGGENISRGEFVDPWGTPYRYFWVYRDDEPIAANRAIKGFLPVDFAAFSTVSGASNLGDPLFRTIPGGKYKTAVGYVLESAGPDKRFGNVWKRSPTQKEIDFATDNITVVP